MQLSQGYQQSTIRVVVFKVWLYNTHWVDTYYNKIWADLQIQTKAHTQFQR